MSWDSADEHGLPLCPACTHLGVRPAGGAFGASGHLHKDVDHLCTVHRARATEGYCTLCGRREPWVLLYEGSSIGSCRSCFVASFGVQEAEWVETMWRAIEQAQEL